LLSYSPHSQQKADVDQSLHILHRLGLVTFNFRVFGKPLNESFERYFRNSTQLVLDNLKRAQSLQGLEDILLIDTS
jgi:hypothetical protein